MNDKQTIMIADDDENVRNVLKSYLEAKDFKIIEATDGVEVMAMVKDKFIPDLIILDIMMPEMNGFEVCEKMRNSDKYAMIPILMLTALSTPESVIKGLSLGADDYIKKPFNLEELYIRVINILKKGNISDRLKSIVGEYKNARDEFSGMDPLIDKLTKMPIMPALFERLRKEYEDGFFVAYVDTTEILKFERILNWRLIDDYILFVSNRINEFIEKNYYKALISVKKFYAGDFVIFLSPEHVDGAHFTSELQRYIDRAVENQFPELSELPGFIFIDGISFKKEKNARFEREIYRHIFNLLKLMEDDKKKYREFSISSAVSGNIQIEKEEIKDDGITEYFVKVLLDGKNIDEVMRFGMSHAQAEKIFFCVTKKVLDMLDEKENYIVPIHKAALNQELIFHLREKKVPRNIMFALDDIDVSTELLYFKEFTDLLRYLNYKIAIYNFGTIGSSLDNILALEPAYVILHNKVTVDADKNYLKQDIVKSLLANSEKLDLKIVGNKFNIPVLKNLGVTRFKQGI